MGMIVSFYRSNGADCTNGGVSAKFDKAVVTNVEGPFEPSADMPALILESHVKGCLRLVPKALREREPGWVVMAGGNFAATSDSRFSQACERLLGHRFYGAVPVHDRVE